MKKIFNYSIAVIAAVAAVSCAKELEIEQTGNVSGQENKIVFTLPASKTALDEGKTVWVEGDKILITDGTNSETLTVPEASAGSNTVELSTALSGKLYAIYPVDAAASTPVVEGQVSLVVPGYQDGTFASANICAAMSENYQMAMRNVTAVVSVDAAMGVDGLVLSAPEDALAGSFTVDLSGPAPAITKMSTSGVISVDAAGGGDTYYAAVIPGTYKAGFSLTAVNLDGEFETKTTTAEKTLAVNQLADMGVIGEDMSGLHGEGTEAEPYQINNLAEYTAFAYSVNLGNKYADKYVKVNSDLNGVTVSTGYYKSTTEQGSFKGYFDGDNHTITVDLESIRSKSPNYVALFAVVDTGAVIKNVKVAGKVNSTGNYAAGLVGYCRGAASEKESVTISNCISTVNVTSTGSYTSGLVAYALRTHIDNCQNMGTVTGMNSTAGIVGQTQYVKVTGSSNSGTISGTYNVGGISGYMYSSNVINTTNIGTVSGNYTTRGIYSVTEGSWQYVALDDSYNDWSGGQANTLRGVGGISGYGQNTTFSEVTNSGTISGLGKVAGIVGASYANAIDSASNTGAVTGTEDMIGGITGWVFTQSNITNSNNSGKITGRCSVGGIAGLHNLIGYSSSNAVSNITNCKNTGEIVAGKNKIVTYNKITISDASAAGGIIGTIHQVGKSSSTRGYGNVNDCVNEGTVTGDGNYVGGITGFLWFPYQQSVNGSINGCSNKGNITGYSGVAGIIGGAWERFTGHAKETVRNVDNSGNITATVTGASNKANAGGILGVSWYNSTTTDGSNYGIRLYNATNTGDVVYADAKATSPAVGGIAGNFANGVIENTYNSGVVKPATGTAVEAAAASTGSVAGILGAYTNTWAKASYNYALEGTAVNLFGTVCPMATIAEGLNSFADADGLLPVFVKVFDTDCDMVLDALNVWVEHYVGTYAYYEWKEGPKGPVFDVE